MRFPRLFLLMVLLGLSGCGGSFQVTVFMGLNVSPGLVSVRIGSSVTFTVEAIYSDGHSGAVPSDVTWIHDSHSWVTWSGNTAHCLAPSPVFFGVPETAQITATATIDGKTYSDHGGVECTL